jgi:hypothetical protein
MIKNIIFLIFCYPILGFIGKPFSFKSTSKIIDITKPIPYNNNYENVIKKIDGFFGVIGPNLNISATKTLYQLLMGNGIINGVFISNGNITYIKRFIKTDKLLNEEIKASLDIFKLIKYQKENRNILFPNILGVANTALFTTGNNLYALHEMDLPYQLNINFTTKNIETLNRVNINKMNHFSAHSKFYNRVIETIDYKLLEKKLSYYQLTKDFKILLQKNIKMKYYPLMHDFINTNENIILFDSPLKINFTKFFFKETPIIPIFLDNKSPTYIYIFDKKSNNSVPKEVYTLPKGYYIFHFADYYEDENIIEIYASIYEKLDFSSLKLDGKYRRVIINKITKSVKIDKNIELEELNLDFPVKYDNKVILQGFSDEFVICEKLNIVKKIKIPKGVINGEHKIIYIDNIAYLLCFTSYDNSSSIILINLENYNIIDIPIKEDLNIGFHSIYMKNEGNREE